MTSPFRRVAAVLAAATLLFAGVACGQVAETGPATDTAGGATIETRFGPVTVPADPKRVVALGWSDAEAALAVGVQPVGVSDWLEFGGKGVGPWSAPAFTETPTLLGTVELSYEQISALEPDLILNTRSDNSQQKHDELSRIAPTVSAPAGVVSYGTSWQQQLEMVSTALGKRAEGDKIIADVKGKFAAAAAQNPQFAGKTVAVGASYSDQYGAYVRGDGRVDFMEALGFVNKPEIQSQAKDNFYVELAREQIEQLDADLTVVFPIGADASSLRSNQVLNQLPSARDGRMVIIDDPTLASAFSSGSSSGVLYAIEHAVPLFAAATR